MSIFLINKTVDMKNKKVQEPFSIFFGFWGGVEKIANGNTPIQY